MLFLLSNDDGVRAPGLAALERALAPLGTCYVVAPSAERSATSHSLSLHEPLRAEELSERWYSVAGSPADAVYMGLRRFCPRTPDLVVCGINYGANVSQDIYYSGTVAAAREATMRGLPALAVSLFVEWGATAGARHHWETAGAIARRVAEDVLAQGLPRDTLLNLNVPDRPLDEVRGVRLAGLGRRIWEVEVQERLDPKGRPYYWLGGSHIAFDDIPGSDGPTLGEGWATLTPLRLDSTARELWPSMERWSSIAGREPAPAEPSVAISDLDEEEAP